MNITKETKLKELLTEYPWLKDEIVKVNDKFRMLNTPMGKIMLGKADIAEMSKKSGYHYIQTDRADQEPLMLEEKV